VEFHDIDKKSDQLYNKISEFHDLEKENDYYGGAYQSLKYARRRKKRILNLAQEKKQFLP
jgi:uncharacterized protein YutD